VTHYQLWCEASVIFTRREDKLNSLKVVGELDHLHALLASHLC
jgi:hypothetical protein